MVSNPRKAFGQVSNWRQLHCALDTVVRTSETPGRPKTTKTQRLRSYRGSDRLGKRKNEYKRRKGHDQRRDSSGYSGSG